MANITPAPAERHPNTQCHPTRDATSDRQLVTIQRRHGGHGAWRTVAKVRANGAGIFHAKLRLAATKKDQVRATAAGSGNSLAFSLTRPSATLRYGPWGN